MMWLKATTAVLLAGLSCFAGCAAMAGTSGPDPTTTAAWQAQAWPISTPEQQGMDSAALARLVEAVGSRKQDSLLVVRHGSIVTEAYYAPYRAGIRHDLRSVTKSVIGTLTAIQIQDGFLDSVDHHVLDLFADRPVANVDDDKKAMTVQNLLDMTSGIAWQEKNYTPDETISRMYRAPDRTQFVLDQPMSDPPGTRFNYDGGNPYLLSALISRTTGRDALEFGNAALFDPLGIWNVRWRKPDAQGVTDGESGLFLEPRDMAKIGYLYLRRGAWDGRQIIPSAWVDRAREGKIPATYGLHYANLWWSLPEKHAYMALGRHSQRILVLPDVDIVAVMTGFMPDDEVYPIATLIDAIVGAVRSDAPLPADAVSQALLAAAIRQAATERPSPVGPASELAKAISGKLYRLGSNALHVKTLSLNLTDAEPSWGITVNSGEPYAVTDHFGGPIGLDGMFRISIPATYGVSAVKGRWLSEDCFEVDRRILGYAATQRWRLTFSGNKVDIRFETTDGYSVELHGEADE